MRSRLCLFLALIFICQAPLRAAGPNVPLDTTARTTPLRFQLFDGYRIVVACPVGNTGKTYNFLVDTGANPSVIDSKLAADLSLEGLKRTLVLPNGMVEAEMVELPMLSIGPVLRQNLPVLVRDLEYLQHGIRIDGIVGMDVLTATNFTIDYQHGSLLFGSNVVKDAEEADFASGPPFVTVLVNIDGQPVKMLVDTGTGGTLFFRSRTRGRLKDARFGGRATGLNMAGPLSVDQLSVGEIQLGKISFHDYSATLLDDDAGWGDTFDGLVGPSALKLKRITFDFENSKIHWKR